ncbi:MAG: GNAT family N-acetyltransferase [Defluviitaleaceae bacterium]|nr:GNAT family N-acetyltransferase [Defluviitaleaceae bacterium]
MGIIFTEEIPKAQSLYELYDELDWNNFLKLSPEQLERATEQSFMSLSAYDGDRLVGTGRIVSDGVINAYLCGLGVSPEYEGRGIGSNIVKYLALQCEERKLHLQLFCNDELTAYYEKLGFKQFVNGMKFY